MAHFSERNLSSVLSTETSVSLPSSVGAYCINNIDVHAAAIALIFKCVVPRRRSLVKPV